MTIRLVCPICRKDLEQAPDGWRCTHCLTQFSRTGGFPDLVVGGRFEDEENESLLAYEELCNEDTTRNFWIPTFRKIIDTRSSSPAVLSLGCGTGVDVDMLTNEGYSAVGVDCGNRSAVWHRRTQRERLIMANGKHLPFEDDSFDVAFCGCVFPHVGVVGDSFQVTAEYRADRLALAREMARVVRPGGRIVVSSPNRWFPFDLFHGREAGCYRPPLSYPGNPFLLSLGDYRQLFVEAGCRKARLLPVEHYWGFIRAKNSWKGWMMKLPVQFVFWLVSRPAMGFLRGSPLNPWLVVAIDK